MSRIIVTGPPGSGTTLVAAALAARLRVRFVDGAELYPTGARAKAAGDPRALWLDALALSFTREGSLVVASGSLSRAVRDRIRERIAGVVFAEVVADEAAAASAARRRRWGSARVPAPLPEVEPLTGDEPGVRVADDADLESVVDRIAALLTGSGQAPRPDQSFL